MIWTCYQWVCHSYHVTYFAIVQGNNLLSRPLILERTIISPFQRCYISWPLLAFQPLGLRPSCWLEVSPSFFHNKLGISAMSKLLCQTCTAILELKSIALEDFGPAGCQLISTMPHNFEDSARQGCLLCLPFVSVLGEKKIVDMRQPYFKNKSLPEEKKYENDVHIIQL